MHIKPLLQVASLKKHDITPIWLMRQAGRYLKEYRSLREKYSFLESCQNPELAAEISLQPYKRFSFDGVILFSDIMTPTIGMGVDLDFAPGPVLKKPIRTQKDVDFLTALSPEEHVPYVLKTLQILKKEIRPETSLIGFCGAPFTVASYLVEGKHSNDFSRVRKMMKETPAVLKALLEKLTDSFILYLKAQVLAGADLIQIFDTWAEILSESEYLEFAFPYEKKMVDALKSEIPVILFAKGSKKHIYNIQKVEAPIVSIDTSLTLKEAKDVFGSQTVLQGNLDPEILQNGSKERIREAVRKILAEMKGHPHIFNLGHGVLKATPTDHVSYLVDMVRDGI
ncbi:MAG: uroporphyrinogen decarboxylase [Deltaproteobacteria bacterium RIFCSPHIGHO2_02_FULL_40_11]|nr:MAG: uroporphyrinogen decarboxylase [Deltaproteobacteria bacterium RIFCSPHIGHO2_02_FULL_40_11]